MTRKEKQIIIEQVQIAKDISERYEQEWLKTWAPTPDLIAESEYDRVNKILQKGGFANMSVTEKNKALTKQWNMIEEGLIKTGMNPEDIDARKHEFWGMYYNKLDKDQDGSFSTFIMKNTAQEQMGVLTI